MNTSSGASLRDSLTTIRANLPSKKRKRDGVKIVASYESKNDPTTEGNTTSHDISSSISSSNSKRKTYINEMIPFLYAHNSKENNGSFGESIGYLGTSTQNTSVGSEKDDKKVNANVNHENENSKKQQLESKSDTNDDINFYKDQLKELKRENENIAKNKERIFKRYFNLVSSYQYGLDTVSKLNDLTSAPDNILKSSSISDNDE